MRIFPTVGVFGNLDLRTGRKERDILFYPTNIINQNSYKLMFANGIVFDMASGSINMGNRVEKVYRFDVVSLNNDGHSSVQSDLKHIDGSYCVVFLKSYGTVLIMDRDTYNSAYVQMFMLEKYDKDLFELVVSSPYSKIYRVKR
jgi:dolichyl-diphosphooligosaccharide--protein glycosyltransferase/undecaprenyl-diphosphooligosaccharide--protein glycosyltransferase